MKQDMNDEEFLRYCESMADTPRCGMVPEHVARLAKLAGVASPMVALIENVPLEVIDCDHDGVRAMVTLARERLARAASPVATVPVARRTIYKFPLGFDVTPLRLRPTDKLLHVGHQNGQPTLWVEVGLPMVDDAARFFYIVPTGYDVDEGMTHVGSVIVHEQGLVWHVYERRT